MDKLNEQKKQNKELKTELEVIQEKSVSSINSHYYICISYNTAASALPDIYARCPRVSAYISGKVRVPVL